MAECAEPIKKNLTWKINTVGLLNEALNNNGAEILRVPMQILELTLLEVATRASQLNDPIMNELMVRLTLYEVADRDSKKYSQQAVDQITERAERARADMKMEQAEAAKKREG